VRWAVTALLVSCANARTENEPIELRLGSHSGIAPMKQPFTGTITANLSDLTFVDTCFDRVERHGKHVTFHLADQSTPAETIASAARFPNLVSVVAHDDAIDVEFANEEDALVGEGDRTIFATGPYEQASFNESELVLRRRSGNGPDLIDVINATSEDEEWRRFLTREFDVIPQTTANQREFLSEVPSVRLVPYQRVSPVFLYFSTQSEALQDHDVRRAISLGLRRGPLAESVARKRDAAAKTPEDLTEARRLLHGRHLSLRLTVPATSNYFTKAALIVQSQLRLIDIDVSIVPTSIATFATTPRDLAVFYGFPLAGFVSTNANLSQWSNAAFDAAVMDNDLSRAQQIFDEAIPATTLFEVMDWAAIDKRFCGGQPHSPADLSWIADLHPCREGETN
jgi:hypothetical protein